MVAYATYNSFPVPFLSALQALGVFGLCQIHAFVDYVRSKLTDRQFQLLFKTMAILVGIAAVVAVVVLTAMDSIHTLMYILCARSLETH